uniref:Uncharacterized protein n=2 Tax=Cynoglossus semilaevis TaxID=244447 RepID=A0A3P8W5Y3_CYNSE
METPSLLRVIDGHKSSVKCLFFNEWYLLSGDSSGQVMVWSTHCHVKDCLMTYNHPKEVKTLALIYLRVVTGCVDGKIRIFNFLTGDCLRVITIDDKTGRILSLHFLENGILVNTICGVRLYKFAKIFWDYSESSEGGQSNMKPAAHLKKVFYKDQTEGTPSFDIKKTDISPSGSQVRDMCQTAPLLLGKEVKATSEELNKRVLQGSTSQKSWDTEELSNTNSTAQMQDWDPHRPPDSPNSSSQVQEPTPTNPVQQAYSGQTKKSRTVLERRASQNLIKTAVTNAADTKKRHHQGVVSKKAQLPSADTQGVKSKAGADTAGAKKTAKTS